VESGMQRVGQYIWDDSTNEWIKYSPVGAGNITNVSGTEITDFVRVQNADDLVTVVQYNEPSVRTTVSGVTYSSATLGITAYETLVSGTNTLTISRA